MKFNFPACIFCADCFAMVWVKAQSEKMVGWWHRIFIIWWLLEGGWVSPRVRRRWSAGDTAAKAQWVGLPPSAYSNTLHTLLTGFSVWWFSVWWSSSTSQCRRRVPSCILTGQQFTVTEASLKGKGGLGIGQDAMEVLRGGHLNISSCIVELIFENPSSKFAFARYHHHRLIYCMHVSTLCILCTTFFLHSGWLFNEHPGDKTASLDGATLFIVKCYKSSNSCAFSKC